MRVLLIVLGLLQLLGGLAATVAAASAIHQILGAISFGMGVLAIGLAAIIGRLEKLNASIEKHPLAV